MVTCSMSRSPEKRSLGHQYYTCRVSLHIKLLKVGGLFSTESISSIMKNFKKQITTGVHSKSKRSVALDEYQNILMVYYLAKAGGTRLYPYR